MNDRPIAHYRICLPRGQAFRFDQIKLLMFRNPVVDVRHNSSTFDMGSMKLKSRNASRAPWSIALHRILSIALFFDFFFGDLQIVSQLHDINDTAEFYAVPFPAKQTVFIV